jgi:hypothetical protein
MFTHFINKTSCFILYGKLEIALHSKYRLSLPMMCYVIKVGSGSFSSLASNQYIPIDMYVTTAYTESVNPGLLRRETSIS